MGVETGVQREGRMRAELAGRAAARFGERFSERVGMASDRALAEALAAEARPVIEALLVGLAGAVWIDPDQGELREAIAMASLFGRRAARLGATPSALLALVPSLLAALADSGESRGEKLAGALSAVCVEGYVAAREEIMTEAAGRRAADAIPIVELAPGCFVILPFGTQEAGELERIADELGRKLLERNARACLVHVGLRDPDREHARRLVAIHADCSMLGVHCVFSGVTDAFAGAAAQAGIDIHEARIEPDFPSGVRAVLDACDLAMRPRGGFLQALRRIVGRR